jgi:carbonic anhydrase/acetyltransferase-like protein (isoleucine patch superfamily)
VILPGARIGNGAVVGANAVVRGTIPAYSIVAGVPGRIIRQRFEAETCSRIEALAWWDWPLERLADAIPDMQRLPILDFLDRWQAR